MGSRRGFWAATALAVGLWAAAAGPAGAAIVFDFEELSEGSYASVVSTKSGVTVTITAQGGGNTLVTNTNTAVFGTRSLLANPFSPVIVNFSEAVDDVSFQFGDFNQDAETGFLEAYSGLGATGTLLGTDSVFYPASSDISNGTAATLAAVATGIRSLLVYTTGTDAAGAFLPRLPSTGRTSH